MADGLEMESMYENVSNTKLSVTKSAKSQTKHSTETRSNRIGWCSIILISVNFCFTAATFGILMHQIRTQGSINAKMIYPQNKEMTSTQTGIKGTHGVKGGIGEKGDQGQIGSKGSIGIDGATGSRGDNGSTGVTGTQGIHGEKGEIGDNGTDGLKGGKGSKGDVGTCRNLTTKIDRMQTLIDEISVRVRLVGGEDRNTGRVEVFYKGEWGTVCDDGWDMNDGNVVCRMLRFTGASAVYSSAHYGPGIGIDIMLDDVACTGSETNIAECSSNGWKTHNCGHNEDASVDCSL